MSPSTESMIPDMHYDPSTGRYTLNLEEAGFESITTAVVVATAALSDADPATLAPISESVDPDALDGLFGPTHRSGFVTFVFEGHRVTVHADREIEIRPLDGVSHGTKGIDYGSER